MSSVLMLQAAQCQQKVRSLQYRIVKSERNGEWRKAKRLCYLLSQHAIRACTNQVCPPIWALVRLEPLAGKLARSVLREERDREVPDLPGIQKLSCRHLYKPLDMSAGIFYTCAINVIREEILCELSILVMPETI